MLPLEADERQAREALLAHVTCRVLRAGAWLPCPADWAGPGAMARNYVALICVGGAAHYRVGGEAYELKAGGLLVTPPHVYRTATHDPADPVSLYAVHFDARIYGVLDVPAVYDVPVALQPAPGLFTEIVGCAQTVVRELAMALPGCVLAANAAAGLLLALILRAAEVGRTSTSGGSSNVAVGEVARLAPVFHVIEARFAEALTLGDLAEAVHLHPAYLSALFKRVAGLSPLYYVARYRLDRARELLLSTDHPVAEIAVATGFRDPSYFGRAFKIQEGVTPRAYRASKKSPVLP
jgi:AraC-like DNA-binding protein